MSFYQAVHIPFQIGFYIGLIIVDPFAFGVGVKFGIASSVDDRPNILRILFQMLLSFGDILGGRNKVAIEIHAVDLPQG